MRSDAVPWTIRGIEFALGVLIVYGLVQLGLAAGNLLLLLFVAIVLPSALEPVGTLRDRLPLGRGATLLVVYATFLVGMVGMAFIVVPATIDQGGKTPSRWPAFSPRIRAPFESPDQDATDAYEPSLPDAASQAGLMPGS